MKNVSLLCTLILQGKEKAFERKWPKIYMLKRSDVKLTTQRSCTANVKYSLTCLIATPITRRRDKSSLPSNATVSYRAALLVWFMKALPVSFTSSKYIKTFQN